MASPLQDDIFDYSNEAIARRTLVSMRDDPELRLRGISFDLADAAAASRTLAGLLHDPELRPIALDALWANTRERALFLFNRVCCVANGAEVSELVEELERLTASDEFVSTSRTPIPAVTERVGRLLEAMGTEFAPGDAPMSGAAEEPWQYHEVIADMRASRIGGTGQGGERLTPLEDGIRRLKVILIAADHLNAEKNCGAPVHISGDIGRAELLAVREYVDELISA